MSEWGLIYLLHPHFYIILPPWPQIAAQNCSSLQPKCKNFELQFNKKNPPIAAPLLRYSDRKKATRAAS